MEVEVGEEVTAVEKKGSGSVSSWDMGTGYEFLDAIEEEGKDEEVENKLEDNKKRKKEDP